MCVLSGLASGLGQPCASSMCSWVDGEACDLQRAPLEAGGGPVVSRACVQLVVLGRSGEHTKIHKLSWWRLLPAIRCRRKLHGLQVRVTAPSEHMCKHVSTSLQGCLLSVCEPHMPLCVALLGAKGDSALHPRAPQGGTDYDRAAAGQPNAVPQSVAVVCE